MIDYKRPVLNTILARTQEERRFIQILAGPRQVGKTTLAQQVIAATSMPIHYASADEPTLRDSAWIDQQWGVGRVYANSGEALLILDEIQKIPQWSEVVKRLWDEDTRAQRRLKVILLGSSPWLIHKGLTESLAGRFEIIPVTHWSFAEMQQAFDWTLDQFIYFGGYPGAAGLIQDEDRWRRYILDALIEPTLSKDILLLTRVDKPVLLRRLFELGAQYSSQILSYQKMLGQLHDAGNTTTLAHYLSLLSGAGMITGLQKYAGKTIRQRGSSPKLQVHNTALVSALTPGSFETIKQQPHLWGRWIESAVGAQLINSTVHTQYGLYYWREHNQEVDFVLTHHEKTLGIEVKSLQTTGGSSSGMKAFKHLVPSSSVIMVGGQGLPLEQFFSMSLDQML